MESLLRAEEVGYLGLAVDGEPYVVPINYAYSRGRLLMHCALTGRKLDMLRANPRVCFTVSRQDGAPVPHGGSACDNPFESVMCWGRARVVEDLAERVEVLREFEGRYSTPEHPRQTVTLERAARCGAIEVVIDRMTGRRVSKEGKQSSEWTRG